MEHLRLILILIGLAVLGLIWLLHKTEGRRPPPGARRREPRMESGQAEPQPERPAGDAEPVQTQLPELGSEFESVHEIADAPVDPPVDAHAERPLRRREPVLTENRPPPIRPESPTSPLAEATETGKPTQPPQQSAGQSAGQSSASAPQAAANGPRIVTLYLRARGQRKLSGLSLLDAAIKAGLRFGEMKIFHRRHRGEPRPVFSMANITRPGSFDPSGWNLFETAGVTLFMSLPGPISALDAWDAMLATGQRLSGILEADLLDDAQCLLTRQRISQIREDMRLFDRKHGL